MTIITRFDRRCAEAYFLLLYGVFLRIAAILWLPMIQSAVAQPSFYDLAVTGIGGEEHFLSEYRGKTLLIVNTASLCGFTGQYAALEEIYTKFKDRGLVVLGFPSNDFGGQEPGSDAEIKQFCHASYHITFPLFAKGAVKGEAQQPLFRYLTESANPDLTGRIMWNFEKFLVDRNGKLVLRFRSWTKPTSKKITSAIEAALEAK